MQRIVATKDTWKLSILYSNMEDLMRRMIYKKIVKLIFVPKYSDLFLDNQYIDNCLNALFLSIRYSIGYILFVAKEKFVRRLYWHLFTINFPKKIDTFDKNLSFKIAAWIVVSWLHFLLFFFQTLTAEIGSVLELKDVDKGIDDYRSTPHLTFDQYRYYLSKEVRFQRYLIHINDFSTLFFPIAWIWNTI